MNIILDGSSLNSEIVYNVSRSKEQITFSIPHNLKKEMLKSQDYIKKIIDKNETVYGINTGFGALSNTSIKKEDLEQLQINLVRSHCTGVGKPFKRETVRAIMLIRANCLIKGYSGINIKTLELIFKFLELDIIPYIPSQGSVGASGDLAPLAHMALCLIGEGKAYYKNNLRLTKEILEELKINPVTLQPKEGLALINGTTVMNALGSLSIIRAKKMFKLCDIAAAMTLDGLQGSSKPFDPDITRLKPHKGIIEVAQNLNLLLKDSQILHSHENCGKVQDPYSLRCLPQIHGACRQTLAHAEEVINIEVNSVTDNPLIFSEKEKVLSGGNFHGENLALCMDYLAMGLSELSSVLERRIEKLMNPTFSELPAFLVESTGLNSGLMIAHVTVAALASENKTLCFPASVDSIPTSTDKEDHVSMGITSGRKLSQILNNLENCIAIEFLCNTQALDFIDKKTSPILQKVHELIRKDVPKITEDRVFSDDIEKIRTLIHDDIILNLVKKNINLH